MIILLIIFFALFAVVFAVYLKHKLLRTTLIALMISGFIVSIIVMLANTNNHLGMKKTESKQEEVIWTGGNLDDPANIMIYQNVGSLSSQRAFAYRTEKNGSIITTVPSANTSVRAEAREGQQASRVITTTKWEYDSDFSQLLFGWAGNNRIAKKVITIYYPSDTWLLMSTNQSKKLTEYLKKLSPGAKSEDEQNILEFRQQAKYNPIGAAQSQVQYIENQLSKLP